MTGGLPPQGLGPSGSSPTGLAPQSAPSQQQAPQLGSLPPSTGGQPNVGAQGVGQGYNGQIKAFGQQINVVDGIAQFNGEQFLVSINGELVINSDKKVIGHIQNNEFIEADDAYIEQLRSKGMIEEGT